jgi:hypothetical protein
MAAFRVAFERWASDGDPRTLPERTREALDQLRVLTASGRPSPRP